jgi:hypothetical protein
MASWVLVTSPIISLSAPCFCNQSVVLNPQAMYKLMVRSCELSELGDPPSLCCNPLTRVATPDPAPALRHDVVTGIWCCPEAVKEPETVRQDIAKSNQEEASQVPSTLRSRTETFVALCAIYFSP